MQQQTDLLVKGKGSDQAKMKAIYEWVATSVQYDFQALRQNKVKVQNAQQAYASLTGVCQDYANLVQAMGTDAGLEVVTVRGHINPLARKGMNDKDPSHAWNLVRLDGKWRVVDATWGAGYSTETEHVERYDPYYSEVDPDVIALTHFDPQDRTGSQARLGITRQNFTQLPERLSDYARMGFASRDIVGAVFAGQKLVSIYDVNGLDFRVAKAPLTQKPSSNKSPLSVYSASATEVLVVGPSGSYPLKRKGQNFSGELLLGKPGNYFVAMLLPGEREHTVVMTYRL